MTATARGEIERRLQLDAGRTSPNLAHRARAAADAYRALAAGEEGAEEARDALVDLAAACEAGAEGVSVFPVALAAGQGPSVGSCWMGRLRLLLIAGMVSTLFGAISSADALATPTFMSCGEGDPGGKVDYRQQPSHCYYTENGSNVNLINLVGIRWKDWAAPYATATAWRVDNSDQDKNGFQRHPVDVVVSDLRPAVGDRSERRLFYTRLRVDLPEGGTYLWRLRRPGEDKRFFLGTRRAAGLMRQALNRRPGFYFDIAYARKVRCNNRLSRNRVKCRMTWIVGDLAFRGRGTIWVTYRRGLPYWYFSYRVLRVNEYCVAVIEGDDCTKTFVAR